MKWIPETNSHLKFVVYEDGSTEEVAIKPADIAPPTPNKKPDVKPNTDRGYNSLTPVLNDEKNTLISPRQVKSIPGTSFRIFLKPPPEEIQATKALLFEKNIERQTEQSPSSRAS